LLEVKVPDSQHFRVMYLQQCIDPVCLVSHTKRSLEEFGNEMLRTEGHSEVNMGEERYNSTHSHLQD
jgi:hypothetical protein